MNVKRIVRLLTLLQALSSGRGQNADGLAAACGVSRRTVFRDLQTLRESGVPVELDRPEERYSVNGAYFLKPTNFTPEEALALILLAQHVGRRDRLPFYEPAQRAAAKLTETLPDEIRGLLDQQAAAVAVRPARVNPLVGKDDFYHRLVRCVSRRVATRLAYNSLTERATIQTVLRPYQVVFSKRSWYVIGRSSLHREVRTFNLGRIESLVETDERFNIPKGFSLAGHLGNAWGIIPEPGPDHKVHVRFTPLVAQNVSEVLWHRTQRCVPRPDGSLDFYATVSGLTEISWWVLGYGDQAEVIAPIALRRLIGQRVAQMQAMYRNGAPA